MVSLTIAETDSEQRPVRTAAPIDDCRARELATRYVGCWPVSAELAAKANVGTATDNSRSPC